MVEIISAELRDADEIINLQRLSYQSEAKLYNDWSLPALTKIVESLKQEFESSVIREFKCNATNGNHTAKQEDETRAWNMATAVLGASN